MPNSRPRSAVCEICQQRFDLPNRRGAPRRRCSKPICQAAVQSDEETTFSIHDDWNRRLAGELHELTGRLEQLAHDADPDLITLLKLVAALRTTVKDFTAVSVLKARGRFRNRAVSWATIGRILEVNDKTAVRRWSKETVERQLYRRFAPRAASNEHQWTSHRPGRATQPSDARPSARQPSGSADRASDTPGNLPPQLRVSHPLADHLFSTSALYSDADHPQFPGALPARTRGPWKPWPGLPGRDPAFDVWVVPLLIWPS
jgi:hypothetical protein